MSAPLEPTTLSIEGMTCSSCVNTVEKALNSVNGVRATVNFATETAHILAPAEMNAKDFIKIVEKAGYSATLVTDVQSITLHSKKSARALFFASIFAIPAVLLSMIMSWHHQVDMWIHEGFTTYTEAIFVESRDGKEAGARYIEGIRKNIRNDKPITGPYGVNQEGSGDMYPKGANLIHMTRTIIDDDKKWREILRGLNSEFGLKTSTTKDIIGFINRTSGKDFTKVYDQYLNYKNIPILEYKTSGKQTQYRWIANVKDFYMPIRINSGEKQTWIYPTSEWKKIALKKGFKPDLNNFYVELKELK